MEIEEGQVGVDVSGHESQMEEEVKETPRCEEAAEPAQLCVTVGMEAGW